jgi:hypothetical protein
MILSIQNKNSSIRHGTWKTFSPTETLHDIFVTGKLIRRTARIVFQKIGRRTARFGRQNVLVYM